MAAEYLLGIDIGTSGTKTLLIDTEGKLIASATVEHPISSPRPLWSEQEREITERADALLERFKLDHMRDEYAGTLSGGQRKLLEMARALMTEPELIMLDEPMAGVNPALTQSLLRHVTDLAAEGITIVFVEHDMDVVRDISDWVVVMAEGEIIAEGPHDTISANNAVIDAYLGSHHDAPLTLEEEDARIAEDRAIFLHEEQEDGEESSELEEGEDRRE